MLQDLLDIMSLNQQFQADLRGMDFSHEQGHFEWRTIGASGPEGPKHGGTHVQINTDTGSIAKGPAKFVGKKVDEVKSQPAKPSQPWSLTQQSAAPATLWGEWDKPKEKKDEPAVQPAAVVPDEKPAGPVAQQSADVQSDGKHWRSREELTKVPAADPKVEAAASRADAAESKADQAIKSAEAAGVEAPKAKEPEPAKPAKPSKTPTVDAHHEFMQRVYNGDVTPDELKANYQKIRSNPDGIKAELNSLTKDTLLKMVGGFRSKADSKPDLVNAAYHGMLQDHSAGRPLSYNPFGKDAFGKAMDAHVASVTPEHIAGHAAEIAARRAERRARVEGITNAIKDPKTLEDFQNFVKYHKQGEAGLSPEQMEKYDELRATATRSKRLADAKPTTVEQVKGTPEGLSVDLKETKHTKTGEPLHVAVLNQRVERDKYDELNRKAKMMGGWYSSFKGGGAIPGFQFKSKEAAEKFRDLLSGNVDRSDQLAERQEAKNENTADRLTDTAESIRQRAEEQLNADRKTNTHRRAEMAAGMEARARGDIAKANTLRNIAEKIKSGELKHLVGVKAGTHVDQLDRILRAAKWNKIRKTMNDQPWNIKENEANGPANHEDVRHVEYPHPKLWASELRRFSKDLADTPGVMRIAQKLGTKAGEAETKFKTSGNGFKFHGGQTISPEKLEESGVNIHGLAGEKHIRVHSSYDYRLGQQSAAQGGSQHGPFYTADGGKSFSTDAPRAVAAALKKGHALDLVDAPEDKMLTLDSPSELEDASKAAYRLRRHPDHNLRSIGERLHDQVEQAQRLRAMDIHTTPELRAALREYLPIRAQKENEDPVKKMERELIGKKIPGFFPTPKPLIHRMVDAADIQPGMSVLEPSAGKGDILDVVKERHPDADTEGVEPMSSLRQIISAKGHKLAGEDFLQHPSEKKYDRIIMNPPWGSEFGQVHEADHVRKAYDHLKPGGRMVAVISSSPFHNQSRKAEEFRNWLDAAGGVVDDLPEGSFSGNDAFRQTGVNTKMITIDKGPDEKPSPDQTFSDLMITGRAAMADMLQSIARCRADFASPIQYPKPTSMKFAGMDIAVENPAGSLRSGVNRKGKKWAVKMTHPYGFIRKANGADGEGLDCFIGRNAKATNVYVIHQNDPETGSYDEDKCMIGFDSPEQAKAAYLANSDPPKFYRSTTIVPLAQFKQMLTKGEPGGAHWKKKNRRDRATDAIFSAEYATDFHSLFDKSGEKAASGAQGDLRWITIGAVNHHGGQAVQIKKGTGEIAKGPSHLRGMTIAEVKKDKVPWQPPRGHTGLFAKPEDNPAAASPSIPKNLWGEWGEAPKKEEKANATPEPATREGTHGDGGSRAEPAEQQHAGGDGHVAGDPAKDEAGAPVETKKSRILTAREHLTKPADPSLVPERLRPHLSDHQIQGVAKSIQAMDERGGFLLADSTGVGKTRQQLAVGQRYADQGKKVLIVTKAEVIKPDWKKKTVTGSFLNDSKAMGVDIALNDGTQPLEAGKIHVTTYDRLSKIKGQVDKNTVIEWDESHAQKNKDSARAKHGMEMSQNADKCLFLTATPVDKPLHLAHLSRAGVFGNRPPRKTYEDLGLQLVDQWAGKQRGNVKVWKPVPGFKASETARRINALYDKMTEEGLMLRRELSMDNASVHTDHIAMPPEAHAAMASIDEAVKAQYGDGPLSAALSLMQQRRQQEPYKIPHVVNSIKDEIKDGRSVVVFVDRVNASKVMGGEDEGDEDAEPVAESEGTAKLLKEALEKEGIPDVLELHGGVSPKARIQAMNDFQAGKGRVIIATPQAGGTGINLDDTAGDRPRTMIMMTAPFSAVDNVQAAGRINRLKTASNAKIRYVFGDTDVDRWNAGIIAKKMKTLGAAVRGDVSKLNAIPPGAKEAAGEEEYEPYNWPSLTGPPSADDIEPRRVDTRFGPKYVHDLPLSGEVEKLASSSNRPQWLSVGEYKGHKKATIWGKDQAEVRDRVRELLSGKAASEPAAPSTPKPMNPEDMPEVEQPPSVYEKLASRLTPEHISHIHRAVKHIAGSDGDMARERNNVGFNQRDTIKGNAMAHAPSLLPAEAARAAHMVRKYKRQMPEEMIKKLDDIIAEPKETKAKPAEKPKAPVKQVRTRDGKTAFVHSFAPSQAMWTAWKSGNRPAGLSVRKNDQGDWEASVWGDTEDQVRQRLEALAGRGVHGTHFSDDFDAIVIRFDRLIAVAQLVAA